MTDTHAIVDPDWPYLANLRNLQVRPTVFRGQLLLPGDTLSGHNDPAGKPRIEYLGWERGKLAFRWLVTPVVPGEYLVLPWKDLEHSSWVLHRGCPLPGQAEVPDRYQPMVEELIWFLHHHDPNHERVHVVGIESGVIGGLRLSEITWTCGGEAGSTIMRSCADHLGILAAAEDFCDTLHEIPQWPDGWETPIDLHGEAQFALLSQLYSDGLAERAAEERAAIVTQLKEAA